MLNSTRSVLASLSSLCFCILLTVLGSAAAFAQDDFTLSVQNGLPSSVDAGVSSLAILSVQPVTPNTHPTVTFSCSVSPIVTNGPTCNPQSTAVAPSTPVVTVDTVSSTPSGVYTFTVTGTSGTFVHTITQVLAISLAAADYTLTVTTAVSPNSVHAGSGATAQITITGINGYTGNVTVECSQITPAVTPPPICSFNPQTVAVTNNAIPPTSTLTISTSGPSTTGMLSGGRIFYALWLAVPGLVLTALGSAGKHRQRFLGWLLLLTVAAGILLMPGCGGSNSTKTTSSGSGTTPNNTYTFTLTGADANGVAPSNTAPTITLTVN
jgi:hypothetical protein